jgi:Uma2 family endonuclease
MATAAARRTTAPPSTHAETVADLVKRLGDIPLERIRLRPPLGTATEKDVVAAAEAADKHYCELVDGVLVEKAMGASESLLATVLIEILGAYVRIHDLGVLLGEGGVLHILPEQVRIPDVCFISWERLPDEEFPQAPVPGLVPNLAVEVLSEGNTREEMKRKLQDYFQAGVELVWVIQPKTQTAEVYTSPTDKRKVNKDQTLDGGDVLPGFRLPLKELFARLRRRPRKGR